MFNESRHREDKVQSVYQLTQQLQAALQDQFFDVWVSGEISNLSRPSSGHIYLSLKDEQAQLRGVIWRSTAVDLQFDLADGLEVVCRGEIDIYPPRGSYQLVIRQMEPLGVGALQLEFKKLFARLSAEGLFESDLKRPLPAFPTRIALVTSPTGAAIRDFMQVATRRWSNLHLSVIPTRVQGPGAELEIARAIELAQRVVPHYDVIVVTRGGGSMEDLWCFNEEVVVRAIVGCTIPVCSAIGHEIDVTLSDFAADVRALTPSEAAELVVPNQSDIQDRLDDLSTRMRSSLLRSAQMARDRLSALAARRVLSRPLDPVRLQQRRLDELDSRMELGVSHCLGFSRNRIESLASRLEALSPLNVLSRGYSLTQTMDNQLIVETDQVAEGDEIETKLRNGSIQSVVTRKT